MHGVQPLPGNPLGNHDGYIPYSTEVGSPNYVEYLTTKYNRSLILTYNFGYPGSTIDNDIDESPYVSSSLREQVEREFLPDFGTAQPFRSWTGNNSLFTIFIGINDIGMFVRRPNASDYITPLLESYSKATEQLHDAGARNFLFINVPAINRAPERKGDKAAARKVAACIQQFNVGLRQLTRVFMAKHIDSAVFFLDANALTNKVLDNPGSYAISSIIKNTTSSCTAYK